MSDNNNGSSVVPGLIAAFAVGALVGAGLAILYAPRSGRETREILGRKARHLKDAASEAFEQGKNLASEARQKAGELYDKSKEAAREVRDAAKGT
jgi:gas vesicle protein